MFRGQRYSLLTFYSELVGSTGCSNLYCSRLLFLFYVILCTNRTFLLWTQEKRGAAMDKLLLFALIVIALFALSIIDITIARSND